VPALGDFVVDATGAHLNPAAVSLLVSHASTQVMR
jgi:hypothetical protein